MSEPVRILQVVTHMNRGGLETNLMNYYRHIDRREVQFDFLVHRAYRADYDDEIEQLGGRIYRIPALNPWSRGYLRALDGFFVSHQEYRVVHVHLDCMSGVVLKAARKHGVPVRIAHSHSSSQDKDLKYLIKLLFKRSIPRYATSLFACGRMAGEWMFGGAPFQILNNAIDTASYQFSEACGREVREALGIARNAFVLGHVGRFYYPKNHEFLVEVFSRVCSADADARLLLVGDGDLREKIQEKVRALGIADRVIFTGLRTDVSRMLQAMDVFVFPSIYEGFPVTMLEAQAAGLSCCISENVPPECILTDRVVRFSLNDPADKWAEWILSRRSVTDKNQASAVRDAGFDIRSNARKLQQYYLHEHAINQ